MKNNLKKYTAKGELKMTLHRFWKNLSQFEDWHKRRWKNIKHRRKDKLRKIYFINVKEFKTINEELKKII